MFAAADPSWLQEAPWLGCCYLSLARTITLGEIPPGNQMHWVWKYSYIASAKSSAFNTFKGAALNNINNGTKQASAKTRI